MINPLTPCPPARDSEPEWPSRSFDFDLTEQSADGRRILRAAAEILHQGELLLGALSPDNYSRKVPAVFNASIGGHYRHCLDHFTSLFDGLDDDLVDYDHRARDPRLEREPEFARNVTRALRARLAQVELATLAAPVSARCEVSYEQGDSPVTYSTVGRELVYAIAHGIHHYALISVMARLLNATLPPNFGVAPSTVAHQKAEVGQ
ncbi:MAG TPA: DinB family protein [Verrucomicrobiota bacterium]|nr:hypothetical protein [Verrucomicrobiales bacterium]HRI13011.1 DinB family protein [Verrucomicrobiota bacterium]